MATVIVVGGGINGVTSAIELKTRGHKVILVDPGPLPHPLAASTDISKAVRAAYGPDEDYTALAERCIELWRKWNAKFGIELYHETGVLFVCQHRMQPGDFEYESCRILEKQGHRLERFDSSTFHQRFPRLRRIDFKMASLIQTPAMWKAVALLRHCSNTRSRGASNCARVSSRASTKAIIGSKVSCWKIDIRSAATPWSLRPEHGRRTCFRSRRNFCVRPRIRFFICG